MSENTKDADPVDAFIAGIDKETLTREELSERWRERVRQDEAQKLASKKAPALSTMSDAEFRRYSEELFAAPEREKVRRLEAEQQRRREAVAQSKQAIYRDNE
jgi:hypothetical protein